MKKFFRFLLAGFFCFMGVLHFVAADLLVSFMPPYLSSPRALVWISGICEFLGGIGVLVPQLRRWAGYGLILLLIVVFPVNLHMALHPETVQQSVAWPFLPFLLWARLPFQIVFVAWVWRCTQDKEHDARTASLHWRTSS